MQIAPSSDQCKGIENLSPLLSCTISDGSIFVRLVPEDVSVQTNWEENATVKFSIGSITNPLSFELTDSFKIYVTTSVNNNYYV